VNPPFTIEQFLGVFVDYNSAIWPAQIGMYVLGLIATTALWVKRLFATRLILFILTLMWAWNAIGYHFLFFSSINPAANIFAGFYVLQAFLFAMCGAAANNVSFKVERDFRSAFGLTFVFYAMAIYPALGVRAGHGLMIGPMFGVAPCPTTIFTIGTLMLARGRVVIWLSVIPVMWSIVGFAAAIQLGIVEDFGLPVASLTLVIILGVDVFKAWRCRQASAPFKGLQNQ
jgi:Family of unknown function (DUF6064)